MAQVKIEVKKKEHNFYFKLAFAFHGEKCYH